MGSIFIVFFLKDEAIKNNEDLDEINTILVEDIEFLLNEKEDLINEEMKKIQRNIRENNEENNKLNTKNKEDIKEDTGDRLVLTSSGNFKRGSSVDINMFKAQYSGSNQLKDSTENENNTENDEINDINNIINNTNNYSLLKTSSEGKLEGDRTIITSSSTPNINTSKDIVKMLHEMGYTNDRHINIAMTIYPNKISAMIDYLTRMSGVN